MARSMLVDDAGALAIGRGPRGPRIVAWLARTPIPVALFVAGHTVMGLTLIGAPVRPPIVAMVLAVTYASYAIDGIVDRAGAPHARITLLALGVSAVVLLTTAMTLAHAAGGIGFAAAALLFPLAVVAYCVRWLHHVPALARRGIARVKDVPYTKNLYTALGTTSATVWAALATGVQDPGPLLTMAAALLVANFVNTSACDLGDVPADRAAGVPTFAVVFGHRRTARALRGLTYAWAAALVLAVLADQLTPAALVAALGVVPKDAYLRRLAQEDTDPLVADLFPDLTDAAIGACTLVAGVLIGA